MIFYLQARGLSRLDARTLLLEGWARSALSQVTDRHVTERHVTDRHVTDRRVTDRRVNDSRVTSCHLGGPSRLDPAPSASQPGLTSPRPHRIPAPPTPQPERVPPPHLWPDQLSRTPINRVHQVPAEAARQRASAKAATLAPDLERRVRREALSSI